MQLVLSSLLVTSTVSGARAQMLADTLKRQNLSEVVVTATRSATERAVQGVWIS